MQEEYVNVTKAAQILGVSRKHIYTLAKRGDLRIERNPLYSRHAPVRIPMEDVRRLKAALDKLARERS